LEELKKELAEK
jgi:hypothetical protein